MAEININASDILFSLIWGILPAIAWLWFWLREDKLHPEPRGRIMLTFIGGMMIVPLVYPFQKLSFEYLGSPNLAIISLSTFMVILFWSIIEELFKYISAGFTALRSRDYDEPIDAPVYLITAALGFAALENSLFILSTTINTGLYDGIMLGNMRFIGASILHIVCSGILGYCIGREFYRPFYLKIIWRVIGLILAITLHTIFNLFIINTENGRETFLVFSCVWITAIVVLLLFEKIKKVVK